MAPRPSRSAVRKSATPSPGARRSPAITFSAMGRSAGSVMRARSNATARVMELPFVVVLDDERHVVSAESRAVAQHRAHLAALRRVWCEVEIAALRIRREVIDRRRNDL